jgi:hypothetical protein
VQKRELLQRKAALIEQRATPPLALQCDLKTLPLAHTLKSKFDVVLVDPPMSCHTYVPCCHPAGALWRCCADACMRAG